MALWICFLFCFNFCLVFHRVLYWEEINLQPVLDQWVSDETQKCLVCIEGECREGVGSCLWDWLPSPLRFWICLCSLHTLLSGLSGSAPVLWALWGWGGRVKSCSVPSQDQLTWHNLPSQHVSAQLRSSAPCTQCQSPVTKHVSIAPRFFVLVGFCSSLGLWVLLAFVVWSWISLGPLGVLFLMSQRCYHFIPSYGFIW